MKRSQVLFNCILMLSCINISIQIYANNSIQSYIAQLRNKKTTDLSPTEALSLNLNIDRDSATNENPLEKKYHEIQQEFINSHSGIIAYMLQEASGIEKLAQAQNKQTFYHGRIWAWNFVNDVWNFVSSLEKNQDTLSKETYLRYRNSKMCDIAKLKALRKDLIKHGVSSMASGIDADCNPEQSEITFMTRTPISNTPGLGECPLDYCVGGVSCSNSKQALSVAFKLLQDNNLNQYKKEIEKLYHLHEKCNKYGELLAVSVDRPHVNELIYPALMEGHKNTLRNNLYLYWKNWSILFNKSKSLSQIFKNYFAPSQALQHADYYEKLAKRDSSYKEYASTDHPFCDNYCFACADIPGEQNNGLYKIHSIRHIDDPLLYTRYLKGWDDILKQHQLNLQK